MKFTPPSRMKYEPCFRGIAAWSWACALENATANMVAIKKAVKNLIERPHLSVKLELPTFQKVGSCAQLVVETHLNNLRVKCKKCSDSGELCTRNEARVNRIGLSKCSS